MIAPTNCLLTRRQFRGKEPSESGFEVMRYEKLNGKIAEEPEL